MKRAREEELKNMKEEEKSKKTQERRKSRAGAGLAAMAAVIGVGEREKDKDKKADIKGKAPEPIQTDPEEITHDPPPTSPVQKGRVVASETGPAAASSSMAPAEESKAPAVVPVATVGIAQPTTQTTISSPSSPPPGDSMSPRESSKVSSWLKSKFSRRASRASRPEDSSGQAGNTKLTKAPATTHTFPTSTQATSKSIEPQTGQTMDADRAEPGFGTDNIPNIVAAAGIDLSAASESKGKHNVTDPTTGLPIDTTLSNPGFGTDNIPHIQPASTSESEPQAHTQSPVEADAAEAKGAFVHPEGPVVSEGTSGFPMPVMLPAHVESRAGTETNLSERDVAFAGRESEHGATLSARPPRSRSTSISSLSSSDDEGSGIASVAGYPDAALMGSTSARGRVANLEGGRDVISPLQDEDEDKVEPGDYLTQGMKSLDTDPARRVSTAGTAGTAASEDMFEEARDRFDEVPPQPRFVEEERTKGRKDSPVRETRFHEEL